ncbi:MAG: hypothetical protein L6R41_005654 [Letrouitia leprolyta]|nr:MAG: hypothetical protein L6R41_005654 [Letrouitia leprolyta]
MSLLSPSRSHYVLAIFLWLSMIFLMWQHYHGLSQLPGRPIRGGMFIPPFPHSNSSGPEARPDENQSDDTAVHYFPQTKQPPASAVSNAIDALLSSIEKTSISFVNDIPRPSDFRGIGDRLSILSTWISARENLHPQMSHPQFQTLEKHIERTIISLFPFARNPAQPKNGQPFTSLRQSFVKNSKGIVLVGSKSTLRPLSHCILNIRAALNSSLPIQVFYASDTDLPPSARRFIETLSRGITTHDIKTFIPDNFVNFEQGGAATVRVFAALASTFEQLLLMDPETIFLQPPDLILSNHTLYKDTGALFFHAHRHGKGDKKETHEFWQHALKNHPPSPALRSSRTYNEGYAEEADASVVVLDKRRISTLIGLLHVCWQNTKRVRNDYTYRYGKGDADSWWFGFELSGSGYAWGGGYGGTVGWEREKEGSASTLSLLSSSSNEQSGKRKNRKQRVCGNTNLQLDFEDRPLWYSGLLAKNRDSDEEEEGRYEVPTNWMVDGVWQRSKEEGGEDCMWRGEVKELGTEETRVLEKSVREARRVDRRVEKFE